MKLIVKIALGILLAGFLAIGGCVLVVGGCGYFGYKTAQGWETNSTTTNAHKVAPAQ